MPMAEDPMNDAHTRLAQARFEWELNKDEEFKFSDLPPVNDWPGYAIFGVLALGAAFMAIGYAFIFGVIVISSILMIAAPAFPIVVLFSEGKRIQLLIVAATIFAGMVFLALFASVFLWVADLQSLSSIAEAWTMFLFSDGAFTAGPWDLLNEIRQEPEPVTPWPYRQALLILLGIPAIIATGIAFGWFNDRPATSADTPLMTGKRNDSVRLTAFPERYHTQANNSPLAPVKETIDFGHVDYDRPPERLHDFDEDQTDEWGGFQRQLEATVRILSPNYEMDNLDIIAKALHSRYGAKAIDFTIETSDLIANQKVSKKEKVFLLSLVAAITKIERGLIVSKVG